MKCNVGTTAPRVARTGRLRFVDRFARDGWRERDCASGANSVNTDAVAARANEIGALSVTNNVPTTKCRMVARGFINEGLA